MKFAQLGTGANPRALSFSIRNCPPRSLLSSVLRVWAASASPAVATTQRRAPRSSRHRGYRERSPQTLQVREYLRRPEAVAHAQARETVGFRERAQHDDRTSFADVLQRVRVLHAALPRVVIAEIVIGLVEHHEH